MPMPSIAVMPDRACLGARHYTDKVAPLEIVPWDSVWATPWDTDAHFVCYRAVGTGQARWPRCNKAALQGIREQGADLEATIFALDFDNPGHRRWTEEGLRVWLADLLAIADDWEAAWQWSLLYTTSHGARLVYVLDTPTPVDAAEGHYRWLVQEFARRGMQFDQACSDWTRIFRLPFVMRKCKPTWEEPEELSEFLMRDDVCLEVSSLGSIDRQSKSRKARVEEITAPKPGFDSAMRGLREISETSGQIVQNKFYKAAKRRLKGRDCYPCLFRHEPIAPPGARHNTILKYVGEAATLLYQLEGSTIERLYALFLDPVIQLDSDRDTDDWTEVLWQHVCYCWAREDAEAAQRAEDKAQREADAVTSLDTIAERMSQWCGAWQLRGSPGEAREYASEHLLALHAQGMFVMTPAGVYDTLQVNKAGLIPRIKALGMTNVMRVEIPKQGGEGWRYALPQDLCNAHGTVVSEIRGQPQQIGGTIRDIDESDAVLEVGLYHRRTDLEPTFNHSVDQWLRSFFGEHYLEGCNWIGHSLAFEEGPCCALSVQGAPGAGKKLLARGLAECVSTQTLAQAEDLVGDFQPGLMKSPYLVVDEGWPARSGGKHPADMFRELVGGGSRYVNRKHKSVVEVTSPVRVVFTANSMKVVQMLTGNRDLSPDDRAALGIRLLHFDIGKTAAIWLRERGGTDLTAGWIKGDGGQQSKFTLAKQFLWIYENMRQPRGKRLLVEGNGDRALMLTMRTQSGGAPLVIEAIISMVEDQNRKYKGVVIVGSDLYMLSSSVLKYYRDNLTGSGERLTINRIGSVFSGLVLSETYPIILEGHENYGRKRWHKIDLEAIQHAASKDGWPCPRIDKLVAAKRRLHGID